MPSYHYIGTDAKGKTVKGKADSPSTHQLYKTLRAEGIYVHSATPIQEKQTQFYRLNAKELSDFSRQLGTMQQTGIPIIKSVSMLLEQDIKPRLKKVYQEVFSIIAQGYPLSHAMEQCKGAFPSLIINMFRSGEASGTMDSTALKMAAYYTGEHKLNTKIKNATAYPSILAVLTVVVTLLMFTLILPNFFDLFTSTGIELNLLTRTVIAISEFTVTQWPVLVFAAVFLFLMVRYALIQPALRTQLDKAVINLPKIGTLVRIVYTARFARTLSSLYSSGVSMLDAVDISVRTIGNRYIEAQFVQVLDNIRSGQSLSAAMLHVDGLEKKLISTIFIGEESGRLDEMLLSISNEYEFESDMAIERMLTYIEPIMIVIMALIVGTVMVAVMVPVMNMRYTIV